MLLWAYAEGGVALAGLVAVVQLVPSALVAPLGSMMGDRLPRGLALSTAYGAGPRPGAVGAREGGPFRAALGGLVALRHDRPASVLLGLVGSLFLVMGAQAGLLLGAIGVGALAGAVVSVVLVAWRRLAPAVLLGLVVAGATLALLAGVPRLVVAAGLLASMGLGKSFSEVAGRTMLQRAVDSRLLSRVFGIQASVTLLALAAASWRSMVALDSRAVYRPELLGLLGHHPFMRHLPVPVLEGLAASAEALSVPAGHAVVREGEPGDRYYLIEEGDLLVTSTGSAAAVGVGAGDGFGEIALLRSVPRTATATTASPCRLWAVAQEDFLAGLGASPAGTRAAQAEVRTKARGVGPDSLRGEAADGTD